MENVMEKMMVPLFGWRLESGKYRNVVVFGCENMLSIQTKAF